MKMKTATMMNNRLYMRHFLDNNQSNLQQMPRQLPTIAGDCHICTETQDNNFQCRKCNVTICVECDQNPEYSVHKYAIDGAMYGVCADCFNCSAQLVEVSIKPYLKVCDYCHFKIRIHSNYDENARNPGKHDYINGNKCEQEGCTQPFMCFTCCQDDSNKCRQLQTTYVYDLGHFCADCHSDYMMANVA